MLTVKKVLSINLLFLMTCIGSLLADKYTTGAKLYMQNNRWNDARQLLEEGIQAKPDSPEINFLLGRVYINGGEYEKAAEVLNKATELDRKGKHKKDIQSEKRFGWDKVAREGQAEIEKHDFEKAAELFRLSTVLLPENEIGHINMGVALFNYGNYGASVEAYNKALAIDPKNVVAAKNLAFAYRALGDNENAIKAFESYVELNPEDEIAKADLAALYAASSDDTAVNKAIESFNEILNREGVSKNTFYNMGIAFYNNEDFTNAARAFEKVNQMDPKDVDAINNLSASYLQLKQFDKAIPHLDRLVRLEPNNALAWENLALAYVQSGDMKKAEETYSRSQEIKEKIEKGEIIVATTEEESEVEPTIEMVSETGEKIDTSVIESAPDHSQIEVGYTEKQVEETWGKPKDTRRTKEYLEQTSRSARDQLVNVDYWTYENFKFDGTFRKKVEVGFMNGKVIKINAE